MLFQSSEQHSLKASHKSSTQRLMLDKMSAYLDHVWTMPQVLVQREGNGSRHYAGKTELINLLNVAAIYNSSVVNPSIDQLSVGDYMEYEYIYKKKKENKSGMVML